jgi:hypothetical protein
MFSFLEFHVCHPFLDQGQISAVMEKIYTQLDDYRVPTATLSKSQKHDFFQLNMVLAIGSIRLSRNGLVPVHPFGFFTAALEAHPPSEYSFCAIEDVENLLLIALFGLFYNIGMLLSSGDAELSLNQSRLFDLGAQSSLCSHLHRIATPPSAT